MKKKTTSNLESLSGSDRCCLWRTSHFRCWRVLPFWKLFAFDAKWLCYDRTWIPTALTSVAYFQRPSYSAHLLPRQPLPLTIFVANSMEIMGNSMDCANIDGMVLSCPTNDPAVAAARECFPRNYALDLDREHPAFWKFFIHFLNF